MEARLEVRTVEERLRAISGRADSLTASAAAERAARERAAVRRRQRAAQASVARAVAAGAALAVSAAESSLAQAAEQRSEAEAASASGTEALKAVRAQATTVSGELDTVVNTAHGTEISRNEHRLRLEQLALHAADEYGIEPDAMSPSTARTADPRPGRLPFAAAGTEARHRRPGADCAGPRNRRPRDGAARAGTTGRRRTAPADEPPQAAQPGWPKRPSRAAAATRRRGTAARPTGMSLADALRAVRAAEAEQAAGDRRRRGAAAQGPQAGEGRGPARRRPSAVPYVRAEQEARAAEAERQLARLGKVNPLALEEYAALQERHQFLATQLEDLRKTRRDLLMVVKEVDDRVQEVFASAYADTAREFEGLFARLFPGGSGG